MKDLQDLYAKNLQSIVEERRHTLMEEHHRLWFEKQYC